MDSSYYSREIERLQVIANEATHEVKRLRLLLEMSNLNLTKVFGERDKLRAQVNSLTEQVRGLIASRSDLSAEILSTHALALSDTLRRCNVHGAMHVFEESRGFACACGELMDR